MDRTTWMTTTQAQPQLQPWRLPEAGRRYSPHSSRLLSVVKGFAPISLDEMDAVALLNRIDTKFVMSTEQLVSALFALQSDYRILSINGQRLNHYRTLYFDTPDFELYNLHVNGRANRYKVREPRVYRFGLILPGSETQNIQGAYDQKPHLNGRTGNGDDSGSRKLAVGSLPVRQ